MKQTLGDSRMNTTTPTDGFEQLNSGLVATMWLCMLATLEQKHMDELGEAKAEVAFDLGIAVQVSEEELVPLPDMMAEVFNFYNEQLELSLPSTQLAKLVAESYYQAKLAQNKLH